MVFDLDGTLIDSQEDVLAAFGAAFRALRLPMPPRERLLRVIGLRLETCFLPFVGDDEAQAAEGALRFREHYAAHHLDHTLPYPGAEEALARLSRRFALGLCTMKRRDFLEKILRAFRWEGHFRAVLGSEEGFPPKPDPAMLREVLRRLAVEPRRALYVGDTWMDAAMAEKAGVPFAFAAYGYGDGAALDGLPVFLRLERPQDLGRLLEAEPGAPHPPAPL
ncbi:MAG: HAD family hydrolase [Acidobacteriota bacterium]